MLCIQGVYVLLNCVKYCAFRIIFVSGGGIFPDTLWRMRLLVASIVSRSTLADFFPTFNRIN